MLSSLSQVGSNKSSPYFSIHKTFGTFLDVFLIFPDSRIDTKGLQESGAHHRVRVHAEEISVLKSAQFFAKPRPGGKFWSWPGRGKSSGCGEFRIAAFFFAGVRKKIGETFFFVFSNVKHSRLTSSMSSSSSAPATFVPNDKITNKNLSVEQGYLANLT